MQMIFGGLRIGATSWTESTGSASSGAGLRIHSSIRARAAIPPAITSSIEANPTGFRLTIRSSCHTPGSVDPSRRKVTNFIGIFRRNGSRIVSSGVMNPLELFALKGKVAVVLGGTSGIGQAIARGYAAAGAITIASSRDAAKVNAMGDELEKLGSKTLRLTSDVQDRASLEALCNEVVLAFGQVDILMVTSGTP